MTTMETERAELDSQSIASIGLAIRAGHSSAEALAERTLQRIAGAASSLNAFTKVDPERVLAAARAADHELRAGLDRGPMHGILYGLKDIYDAEGYPTSCNSHLRAGHIASADSAVAARFKAAGAILVGKLATHEFAIGVPDENSVFPPARNPWNTAHVTGGSSSGSAAAVAAGLLRVATGSCTGGSIRGPAAWCGIVGLKPTYGLVSRQGVAPLSWTLDHCGPMTKTVAECAVALKIMAQTGEAMRQVPDYAEYLGKGVRGLKIGVPRAFFENSAKLSAETSRAIEQTIERLRSEGAIVEDVALPDLSVFNACGRVLIAAEMYAVHQGNLRMRIDDYELHTVSRLTMGAAVTTADYLNALRVRSDLAAAVNGCLASHDALLTASSLDTAPRVDAGLTVRDWPLQMNMFNVTGHPAASLPVGLSSSGMPLSVQLVGRPFDEARLLGIAHSIEQVSGWLNFPSPSMWETPSPRSKQFAELK